ncbi:MAG: hypothetical protein R2867_10825 [Caldilineaceae bacterium]
MKSDLKSRSKSCMPTPNSFDWTLYGDATLAGLSVLIPLPFVDSVSENFFRSRMIKSIARRHQAALEPQIINAVNHTPRNFWSRLQSCLLWPVRLVAELILSLSRKIFYVLSIKKAVDALNHYWQRAYLLDYMIGRGYLREGAQITPALMTLDQVLAKHSTSPLNTLAREIVQSPGRLVRSVRQARRGTEDKELLETQRTMRNEWSNYDEYFRRLQESYESLYQANLNTGSSHT